MYSSESFSEVELEEIKSLAELFSDLETGVIRQTYLACDKDVKWARERLAEIAKHPSVQSQFMTTLPVSTGSQSLGRAPSGMHSPEEHFQLNGAMGAGAAATGLAALALAPAPSDAPSNSAYLPAFDVNTLTETLTQVGASVTDGITSFASNITGWVADLASAFDAGWGDEGDERIAHVSDKNEPSVGYGTGLGIDRPYQRRLGSANSGAVTSNSGAATANRSHDQDPEGEEEGWEDEVDGYGKDD